MDIGASKGGFHFTEQDETYVPPPPTFGRLDRITSHEYRYGTSRTLYTLGMPNSPARVRQAPNPPLERVPDTNAIPTRGPGYLNSGPRSAGPYHQTKNPRQRTTEHLPRQAGTNPPPRGGKRHRPGAIPKETGETTRRGTHMPTPRASSDRP